jgi:hypothetical protein
VAAMRAPFRAHGGPTPAFEAPARAERGSAEDREATLGPAGAQSRDPKVLATRPRVADRDLDDRAVTLPAVPAAPGYAPQVPPRGSLGNGS